MPPTENWSCLPSFSWTPPGPTVKLIFIVNGEDTPTDAELGKSIEVARDAALRKTHNTGRPFEEWEIRDERGVLLPTEMKVKDFGFKYGVRLFLTLKVGIGGEKWGECPLYKPQNPPCLRCQKRFVVNCNRVNPAAV